MRYYYGSRFKEHWEDIAKMVEENYSQDYDDNDCLILSVHLIKDIHNGVEIIEDYNPDYNKKIVYQLEPLVENHWCGMTDMINCIRDYDEVWDYDLNNIEILKQNGIDAKFKPLIYSENLKKIENKEEPDIDVLFYGTQTDYRIKTISTLIGRYLYCDINFISINNVTGSLLDDFISRSKIILDLSNDGYLHQRIQKQTRIFYALINNKCVISEKSDKNYFGNLITEVNIDEDLSELGNIINDYIYNKKWKEYLNVSDKFKQMNTKKPKIVMISMFKNESKGIRRMLESVYKHIDFYVFQDNGSTDGTPDIVKEFFADKDIPGFIYNVEEGWVGFGWNRDHLLQTTLRNDHGCDWIMKMDCDEYLEVDDDFDWSPFYNTNTESFHVTAQNPGCVYYRAWIWNAKLPWKFQHDPAHEVIYLDNKKGENFERVNLPRGLRMIGTNDGESYTVRTKYITDALKLEERLIREETMLTDTYHFWYIAKSYMDCYAGDFYALGQEHSKEFARRFIFYFKEYLKHMNVSGIHEMSYFSTFSIGLGYKYLKEYEKAIEWFNAAEKYCPVRNEHIVHLAQTYDELQQYDKMLEQTTRLINPERKLPFPDYYFLIDNNIYCDSGDYPQYIHDYALSKISEEKSINSFSINITTKPRLWIVDDFYTDPHAVREFALQQEFDPNLDYYKGSRTKDQYIVPGTKEAFEKIIGKKITNWTETHGMCGRFQYCTAEDALVYHCDGQTLAGMVYLTPDAPFSCGTSLYAHKDTKLRNENDFEDINVFEGGFYDKSKFELVDTAGNVFNRLVLFDAKCIHSANEYFGTTKENSRLFHLFFFD
jgi:hypothetical protein